MKENRARPSSRRRPRARGRHVAHRGREKGEVAGVPGAVSSTFADPRMPELPDITVYVEALQSRVGGGASTGSGSRARSCSARSIRRCGRPRGQWSDPSGGWKNGSCSGWRRSRRPRAPPVELGTAGGVDHGTGGGGSPRTAERGSPETAERGSPGTAERGSPGRPPAEDRAVAAPGGRRRRPVPGPSPDDRRTAPLEADRREGPGPARPRRLRLRCGDAARDGGRIEETGLPAPGARARRGSRPCAAAGSSRSRRTSRRSARRCIARTTP